MKAGVSTAIRAFQDVAEIGGKLGLAYLISREMPRERIKTLTMKVN